MSWNILKSDSDEGRDQENTKSFKLFDDHETITQKNRH